MLFPSSTHCRRLSLFQPTFLAGERLSNTWSILLYRAVIRVSLVVTETVDAGLLGEHTIPTLRHAWRELLEPANLASAGGHVIPCGARVYATAIECVETRQQSRYVNHAAFHAHNSSQEGAMKLKLYHSAPLEMPFPMVSFFAEGKIFRFWQKTMDYNPWFCFSESKKSLEKSIPPYRK